MPAARNRGLKCLCRAEFHACGIGRQAQRDVARDRQGAGAGFCRVGMARGRDLHRRGRGQVSWRGVHAGRGDRSQRRISAGTLSTLQLTAVSVVFVTVAVKVAWPPSTTDPFVGFSVTSIDGGGGGGGDTPPAPQPSVHAPSVSSAMTTIVFVLNLFPLLRERDRMPSAKQAKGQRRGKGIGVRE